MVMHFLSFKKNTNVQEKPSQFSHKEPNSIQLLCGYMKGWESTKVPLRHTPLCRCIAAGHSLRVPWSTETNFFMDETPKAGGYIALSRRAGLTRSEMYSVHLKECSSGHSLCLGFCSSKLVPVQSWPLRTGLNPNVVATHIFPPPNKSIHSVYG